jgi:hypothetical protein
MTWLHPQSFLLFIGMSVLLSPLFLVEKSCAKNEPLALPQINSGIPILLTPRSPRFLAQQSDFTSFFEEGRLLSENRLRRQPPDPTIPVASNSQFWQPVFFRSGGVSFWMPPGTLSEERVVLPTQVGALSFRTLAANSDTDRSVVGYAAQLTPAQLRNPQLLLSAMTNKVIASQKFTLVRNRPITQNGVQGRELLYQSDAEVIVFRAFLRQDTAYVIGSRSPKSEGIPSRKSTIFLNSFEFSSQKPSNRSYISHQHL